MAQSVIIQWSISSFFGWGVYGLNLALHWANDPDIEPVCASPIDPAQIAIDQLRGRAILPFLVRSLRFQAQIASHANGSATANAPLLLALGNGFLGSPAVHNVVLEGQPRSASSFSKRPLTRTRSSVAGNCHWLLPVRPGTSGFCAPADSKT
jgi:hypothetical protein